MRWKADFSSDGKERRDQRNGVDYPGKIDELVPFEKELIVLVKNIKF